MPEEEEPLAPEAGRLMAITPKRRRSRVAVVRDSLLRWMEASI